MKFCIETPRLFLREFLVEDAPLIYELNRDPAVTRFTLDPMSSLQQAEEVLQTVIIPQYRDNGFGRWAVYRKDTQAFIGWCGLKRRPELDEIDLGYRFNQQSWGKGFATESAAAVLKAGFDDFNIERIVGRALPGNSASIRVLEKIGMQQIEDQVIENLLHKTFEAWRHGS